MSSLSFPTTHLIAIWRKKHKCMGNLPTFSAFRIFEVEVATDNRDFRLERMEISKHGKRQKNAQKAEESEKPSFIVVPRLWAKRECFKVECYIFFAPEDVIANTLETLCRIIILSEIYALQLLTFNFDYLDIFSALF